MTYIFLNINEKILNLKVNIVIINDNEIKNINEIKN